MIMAWVLGLGWTVWAGDGRDTIAEAGTTLAHLEEYHSLQAITDASFRKNPVQRWQQYATNLLEVAAYYNSRGEDEAFVLQEGNRQWAVGGRVDSYYQLGDRNVVWGGASYQQGGRKNVKWNSTSDFQAVYPYVLADSMGGNLDSERYTFYGGCATRLGNWMIGEELTFRAEHEWRTYDPRPRGIVTDLLARLGGAYDWNEYRWGVGAGFHFYKQTNDVDFYQEAGVIPEYQMTGLGEDYERFKGTNNSAYYKAAGWLLDVNILPQDGKGIWFAAEMGLSPYRRVITTLNALPISKLNVWDYSATAGWNAPSGRWYALAGMKLQRRLGNELIAGSSSSNDYQELGYLTMYRNRFLNINGVGGWNMAGFETRVAAGFQNYKATYEYPSREMSFSKVYGRIDARWKKMLGEGGKLSVSGYAAYYHNIDDELQMPYALMDEARAAMVRQCALMAQSSYLTAGGGARYDWLPRWKAPFGVFIDLQGGYRGNKETSGYEVSASAGLFF